MHTTDARQQTRCSISITLYQEKEKVNEGTKGGGERAMAAQEQRGDAGMQCALAANATHTSDDPYPADGLFVVRYALTADVAIQIIFF